MIASVMFAALFLLLILGTPIGFALTAAGVLGLLLVGGWRDVAGILEATPISAVSQYELLTIPMFILMGELIVRSRIADKLFQSAVILLGRLPAGLAIATALFGAGFGAISGSSVAGAATLASTSTPAMLRNGYETRFATGVVSISGTLAMLIPPSIALILYSILTETNTAKLLIAGLIPGLVVTGGIILTLWFLVWRNPDLAPRGKAYGIGEKLRSLWMVLPTLLLMTFVAGALYSGLATPVETSAIGAFIALCIAVASGSVGWRALVDTIARSARTTAMIAMILIGAAVFGYAMTLTQTTQQIVAVIADLPIGRYGILLTIIVLILILGCFLDQAAILVLTIPILVPIIQTLGFDPIWFGVIVVVAAEVGMVTPPIGLNVYIVSKYTNIPATDIFIGVTPHVIAHLIMIGLFIVFPQIVMWLPDRM